ncbi:MAG: hypothetical protein ACRCXT_05350 [Paraclostridium sp.]
MKKNILSLILILGISILLGGCSNRIVEKDLEVENLVPSGLNNEIGSGQFVISTISTKSQEETPVIFVDEFKSLAQLGFQSEGFDGSRCSYIYIDGELNTIENLGEMNSITLTLGEENLIEGTHKVEVIQFDNDKTSGTPITYKISNYEVKNR